MELLTTILTGLFWVLVAVLVFELLRWAGRAVAHKRARQTTGQKIIAGLEDAVAHARGDSSRAKITRPKAPEIGSGLPAGAWDRNATLRPWKAGD